MSKAKAVTATTQTAQTISNFAHFELILMCQNYLRCRQGKVSYVTQPLDFTT